MDSYKTIRSRASDEYIVKKSRFIGSVCPVTTQEEALEFIKEVSKKYWDATHNVYAYILRDSGVKRFSDDGEPQGTAGIPALDVIEKSGITDCAVVQTRHFGGIMLGAGGLVRAYAHSASIALAAGGTVTRAVCERLVIRCDYNFYGRLSSLIPECGGIIEDSSFESDVTVIMRIPKDKSPAFEAKLTDASFGKYKAEKTDEFYADID